MTARIIIAVVFLCLTFGASARKKNTESPKLIIKESVKAKNTNNATDTLVAQAGMLQFSGYEKTVNSDKETMFVTNLIDDVVVEIVFTIGYYDAKGRQLHSRQVRQAVAIPPAETRRIDIKSWDKQKTFYYAGSAAPSRKQASPFTVTVVPDQIVTLKQ